MSSSCKHCQLDFVLSDFERQFLAKVDSPAPSLCPDCREQRRLAHINQLHLFHRKCAISSEDIITHYSGESELKVCSQQVWYSDQVDNAEFAKDFDFNRPFFEQFHEMDQQCYRPALFTDYLKDENCAYTNYAGKNKDCYLIFDSDENRDCYYSYSINSCRNSIDVFRADNLELCYEATDSRNCYSCSFVSNCEGCSDSAFINNCIGCKRCIMCSNLHQKELHVLNRPVSEERYLEVLTQLRSRPSLNKLKEAFAKFIADKPEKALRGFQNENVSGNYLVNCKNAFNCYDSRDLWDASHCYQIFMPAKDCMDCNEVGEAELCYECTNLGYNAFNILFSLQCLNQISNISYSRCCFNGCSNLFGCSGLKRAEYHILNKPYEKDEYEALVHKIIEHMKETGEWGEFFPIELSDHGYNTSLAQEYFSLDREEALGKGFRWLEQEQRDYQKQSIAVPEDIDSVSDSICQELLACTLCTKKLPHSAS